MDKTLSPSLQVLILAAGTIALALIVLGLTMHWGIFADPISAPQSHPNIPGYIPKLAIVLIK